MLSTGKLFTRFYDEGSISGGSVPAETAPTQITPDVTTPAESTPDTPDISTETPPASIDDPSILEPPETPSAEPDESAPADKAPGEFDEGEYLRQMGLDGYDSVDDALIDLHEKVGSFDERHEKTKKAMDQLEGISKTLGLSPDDVLASLSSLDPQNMAQQGPQWNGIDQHLQKYNVSTEDMPFYKDLANSMADDIAQQIQSQVARYFNSMHGNVQDLRFDFQMEKYLQNGKHADWNTPKRRDQVKKLLQENPKMMGKSNAIDWAVRYLSAGETPKSEKVRVNELTKKRIQEIQAKKVKLRSEPAGRGAEPISGGAGITSDSTAAQLAADIKRRLNKGETISNK